MGQVATQKVEDEIDAVDPDAEGAWKKSHGKLVVAEISEACGLNNL